MANAKHVLRESVGIRSGKLQPGVVAGEGPAQRPGAGGVPCADRKSLASAVEDGVKD
jgi:hypothetical protein